MGPSMATGGSLGWGRVECMVSGVSMTTEPDGVSQNGAMQASGHPEATLLGFCLLFHFSSPMSLILTLFHFSHVYQNLFLILYIPESPFITLFYFTRLLCESWFLQNGKIFIDN